MTANGTLEWLPSMLVHPVALGALIDGRQEFQTAQTESTGLVLRQDSNGAVCSRAGARR